MDGARGFTLTTLVPGYREARARRRLYILDEDIFMLAES
jgi:hypothetical protein